MQPLFSLLAQAAKEGVHSGGGCPLKFGTVAVSDGISMGHEGMHFSLFSREGIADLVDVVMQAERLGGSVLLAGCETSIPSMLKAAIHAIRRSRGKHSQGSSRLADSGLIAGSIDVVDGA